MKNKDCCTFCQSEDSKENPILGSNDNSSFICKSCVETSQLLLQIGLNNINEKTKDIPKYELNPYKIKNILDQHVVGQHAAKRTLSVSIHNHFKRIKNPGLNISKSNVLIHGNSGSGKTHLVETIARELDISLAISDANTLTAAGYIGDSVESIISKLYQVSGKDLEKTQNGIIFIDEIDKISYKGENGDNGIGNKSVQQALLKIVEGTKIEIDTSPNNELQEMKQMIEIDTSNILFICAGAFPGIGKKEVDIKIRPFGLIEDDNTNIKKKIEFDDLIEFGMIPELIGRLHTIIEVEPLNLENLIGILTEPKNNIIQQYKSLLEIDDIKIDFTKNALKSIAEKSIVRKTGARALRSIVEEITSNIMYKSSEFKGKSIKICHNGEEFTEEVL